MSAEQSNQGPPGDARPPQRPAKRAGRPKGQRARSRATGEAPGAGNGRPGGSAADEQGYEGLPCPVGTEIRVHETIYLWPHRLPSAGLVVMEGRKGAGKTSVGRFFAAVVTGGAKFPSCRKRPPKGVVWLTREESIPSVAIPKLKAAGADLDRIAFPGFDPETGQLHPLTFPGNLPDIERAMDRVDAGMLVVDGLNSFAAPGLNLNFDQDARRMLEPICELAGRRGVLVVAIRHVRKSTGGPALDHGLGSVGIGGLARVVLCVKQLEEPPGRRVLITVANNLELPDPPVAFDLKNVEGKAQLVWQAEMDPADPLLNSDQSDPGQRNALDDAKAFLRDALHKGPKAIKELQKQAEDSNISRATLRRAKTELGITSKPTGPVGEGRWRWYLPKEGGKKAS